jgi:hypothetical protein
MPTMVATKCASRCHALGVTPTGAGSSQMMTPARTLYARAFRSAPRGAALAGAEAASTMGALLAVAASRWDARRVARPEAAWCCATRPAKDARRDDRARALGAWADTGALRLLAPAAGRGTAATGAWPKHSAMARAAFSANVDAQGDTSRV